MGAGHDQKPLVFDGFIDDLAETCRHCMGALVFGMGQIPYLSRQLRSTRGVTSPSRRAMILGTARVGRGGMTFMNAEQATSPVVHFVGSIPLPDSETVFRTLSGACRRPRRAAARRRDRHPQDPGSTSCRTCWRKIRRSNCATDVPPFKFVQWDGKVVREIPRLRIKPGMTPEPQGLQDRLCRHGDRVVRRVRPACRRPASFRRA